MKMIFGLGNPEKKFDGTPHNLGFFVLDKLCEKFGGNFSKKKLLGLVAEIFVEDQKVLLIKPQTYMNNSGECVFKFTKKFKMPLKDILIISDDIDIEPGTCRFRQKGSAGTHNGLKSVISCLNSTEFPRLRIGAGKPPEKMDLTDYVLSKLPESRQKLIEEDLEEIIQKIVDFLES